MIPKTELQTCVADFALDVGLLALPVMLLLDDKDINPSETSYLLITFLPGRITEPYTSDMFNRKPCGDFPGFVDID
ncbi:hypothetical protein Tco_1393107 [Tanacetum coccineum]